jgi:hypothetical protein
MRKLTPIILAFLMMVSTSLAVIDFAELDDSPMTNADGRVGPDAEVVAILSPKETTTDDITGDVRNTLRSGDVVNFEAFISNAGDAAITEMGVSVTVYLAEDGVRGMVARDSSGNDLSWTNGDVVCDDSNVCPWATLDAGANLANGKYTLNYQGAAIEWLPIEGDYVVVVEVSAEGDNDPGNDYQEILVSVTEWTDIVVDLAWDSGKETEGGAGHKAFTLTVTLDGSSDWTARSITLALDVTGTLSNATDGAGNSILGTTSVTGVGTSATVETFRHELDANNTSSDTRHELSTGDTWEYFGTVIPDSSIPDTGDYKIEVNLVEFILYGQLPDCTETTSTQGNATNPEPVTETFVHFCEVTFQQDDVASTSEAEIEGTIAVFHDIGVSSLVVNQGYQMDGDGNPIGQPSMPGLTEGPLNPAMSTVQATVRHLGSDLDTTYDWSVTFSIVDTVTGMELLDPMIATVDSCDGGFGEAYVHAEIGNAPMDPQVMEMGQACLFYDFAPGIYDITATATLLSSGLTDMSTSNNDGELLEMIAMNNRPSVSLTVENEGDIIIGSEAMLTLAANAIDADDDSGQTLRYVWNHPGLVEGQESPCTGDGAMFSQCMLMPVDSDWAGVHAYSVTVFDAYSSSSSDTVNVFIWNHVVAVDSADDFSMEYDLTYNGVNTFTIDLEVSSSSHTKDLTAFGYAGEYNSEAVLDYTPLTTYTPGDVLDQSITLGYDAAAVTPTSVFYVSPNGQWIELDATISAAGTVGTIDIELADESPVLPGGEIALMGGEIVVVATPDAYPSGLVLTASAGGHIDATWGYTGTLVDTIDSLEISVCDSAGTCTSSTDGDWSMDVSTIALRLDGQTYTNHGETYTVTIELCHQIARDICNPTIATASATADSGVDGDATATDLTVSNKDDNTWTVSWTVAGDASDVDHWMVCFGDASWDVAGAMPSSNCVDAADGAATADIGKPGADGMYHFTAVGVDAMGNHNNDVALNSMILERDTTEPDPCAVNPDSDECKAIGTVGEAEGVPGWTWGVIIGLVVVAFVVGAFILSRGGEGDEGKDWDY